MGGHWLAAEVLEALIVDRALGDFWRRRLDLERVRLHQGDATCAQQQLGWARRRLEHRGSDHLERANNV